MVVHHGHEFFVVAPLMHPAETLFSGDKAELGCIITDQQGHNRGCGLVVVSGQGCGFEDPGLLLIIEAT